MNAVVDERSFRMVDVHTAEQRSRNMRAIRAQDTKPEMLVRRYLHSRGFRYRLHDKALPGAPDVVFRGKMKAIFVNGCFWHSHSCPRGLVKPKTNSEFWVNKRDKTIARDQNVEMILFGRGWTVLTVWECELKSDNFGETILKFLESR